MFDRITPRDLERALLWVVTAYRVFGAAWMMLLGGVVLASKEDPVGNPTWVVVALALVAGWTILSVALAVRAQWATATWLFVGIDIAIGMFAVFSSVLADSILFAGGYPLAAVFAAVYAKGSTGGAVAAIALTAAALARLPGRPSINQPAEVSIVISYLFSAAAASGGASVLRASDHRRAEAEEALAREQAARTRADERAEVAAHLHDSVLQTLAMIQRDSSATDQVRGLARSQERELRRWLYQADEGLPAGFREAVTAMAAEIDDMADATVDVVVVGEAPMDEHLDAIVRAGREAVLNAAKHAAATEVQVYAEVGPGFAEVYVKDRGSGFDPDAVPDDRRGIADSIVGRMERHGGNATIQSTRGEGTEVRLSMPRGQSA
ncbi:MAG: histidine kinase [Acidimicrobiia bacterium]|nr:histidine kinase [Acidimicrobiia bacterium]